MERRPAFENGGPMRAARSLFLLLGMLVMIGCQAQHAAVEEDDDDDSAVVDSKGNTKKSTSGGAPTKVKILEDPAEENKRAKGELEKLNGLVGVDDKSEDKAVVLVNLGSTAEKNVPAGLANLKGLKKLQELYLAYQPITDSNLSQIAGLKSLKVLSLYKTKVSDAGMSHLAGLSGLQDLDLAFTKVTDAGVANLKGLGELKRLNLAFTGVTDASVGHLKGLAKLEYVSVGGSKITDKGVEALQTALPKATIRGGSGAAAEAKTE